MKTGNGTRMGMSEETIAGERHRTVKPLGKNNTTAPGRDRTGNLEKSFIIVHHRMGIVL